MTLLLLLPGSVGTKKYGKISLRSGHFDIWLLKYPKKLFRQNWGMWRNCQIFTYMCTKKNFIDLQNWFIFAPNSLLFIVQKAVKAQIIVQILKKMLPNSGKNNFIDFLIKFHFIDFFAKLRLYFEKKIYEIKFDKEIYEIIFVWIGK